MNHLGAVTTIAYFSTMILIFILRLLDKAGIGSWLGLVQTVAGIVLTVILLVTARQYDRPTLYYIQVVLFLVFLVVELLLDYIIKIDFRQVRWMVISYVTFFFAATGGMIGVASTAGRGWSIAAVVLYLVMAALAFIQRAVTGM